MWPASGSPARLVALALAAAACTAAPEPRPVPPTTPPPAGVIRLGYPSEPRSLNPIEARDPASRDILRAVLPSFFTVTPDLRYRPALLAEEPTVTSTEDRMEVAFRIRDGARWSDGTPITVDDVAFTWQVMRDPDLDVRVGDGFEKVLGVERDGPTRGRLVLRPPYTGWRDLFSAGRFVLPRQASTGAVAGWDQGPPVSGGPFAIAGWTRGLSVRLRANPMAPGGPPRAAGIDVTFVPDPTTALQLLEEGELDVVAPMLGAAWVHRLGLVPGVQVSTAFGTDQVHLLIDPRDVPRAEQRRRIVDGIDRARLADVLLRGSARRADGVLAPGQAGAVPAWTGYGDGEREASVSGELTLAYPRSELMDLTARYLQAEMADVGVDVDLVALDAEEYWGRWLYGGRGDMLLWESRSGPDPWLDRWFLPGTDEGVAPIRDRTFRAVVEQMSLGGPEGGDALGVAQALLAEEAPVLPLFQVEAAIGARGVSGVRANATVDGPLWNAAEWAVAP